MPRFHATRMFRKLRTIRMQRFRMIAINIRQNLFWSTQVNDPPNDTSEFNSNYILTGGTGTLYGCRCLSRLFVFLFLPPVYICNGFYRNSVRLFLSPKLFDDTS